MCVCMCDYVCILKNNIYICIYIYDICMQELAEAAGGKYHYIPKADDASISSVAKNAIASFGLK